MSLRRSLPAGVLDAAFNSLGTFAVGLTAVRIFEPSLLGVYEVFFAAHLMGVVVPMYLIYLPAEIRAVGRDMGRRLPILRRSVLLAAGPSLLTGFAVVFSILVTRGQASSGQLVAFTCTTAAATMLMPLQAHLRRMLHLAGHSWKAMTVSSTQLVAAIAGVLGLLAVDVPDAWIPFGALTGAALVSTTMGLLLARPGGGGESDRILMKDLVAAGRWLLVTGIVPTVALFVVAALINQLAGPDELGYAGASRLAAQPILVLGIGLNAVLGPRSMEAAHRRDRPAARRVERIFIAVVVAAAGGYLVLAGGPWVWNPLYHLIPLGYHVTGLTALMILTNTVSGMVLPLQRELFGGRAEKRLARIEIMASTAGVAVAASAGATGAFARPLSLLAQNGWRAVDYRRALRPLYADPRPSHPDRVGWEDPE
jgi:O-antigen/teichoic acid export membrane protein